MSEDWRERAACRNAVNPEVFFAADDTEALRVCAGCPVRAECLADALRLRDVDGVRAGLTGHARRMLLRSYRSDAAPVEEIVRLREELRWSVRAVTVALGVSTAVVHQAVSRNRASRVDRSMPVVGVVRRRQALGVMGHSLQDIASRLPMSLSGLQTQLQRDRVTQTAFERWCRVYDELSTVRGPNEHARQVALRLGWPGPDAWDASTIDDPNAQPRVAEGGVAA